MKVLSILLSLFLVSNAYAAETGNESSGIIDLNTIVINASRIGATMEEMTHPVSVITSEDIAKSSGKSLPEILGESAGVYGVQYGNIKNSVVDMRGSGESSIVNVLVLVDGRRTNQIDLSGQDWAQIDPSTVDRVEIIRGSGTVLYGDNANSGVINIITKKGQKNTKPTVTLSEEWGSYQTGKQGFELTGGTSRIDYQLNYSHEETTGYRAQSDYWGNDLNTHLGFDVTNNFSVDVNQGYHLDRYQLPGALFISNIDQFGRRGVRPSINNDHGWTSDSHYDVTPKYKFDFGVSEGELTMFTSARKRMNKYFTGSSVYESSPTISSYEFQPKVELSSPLSDKLSNKATVGYDYFYAKDHRRSGTLGTVEDDIFISKVTHAIYALDELILNEKWLMNAGARGAWAQYNFDQRQALASEARRTPATQGYEAGLGYKYNPDSKVYLSYSRSYRLPAVDEFYQNVYDFGFGLQGGLNTDLTYQVGNQYEVGIKDRSIKNTKLGLNFFRAQYKHEIYLDPTSYANTNYNGKTLHYGLEAEASVLLLDDKVEFFVNWTLQEANFRGGTFGGSEIPAVPDQLINAGVTYRPFEGFSTSLTSNYVGQQFALTDEANLQPKTKRYTTVDWNAKYGFKNMEFWVSLRNILDRKYYAYGSYSAGNGVGYYPAPTRNVSAGVKVKF